MIRKLSYPHLLDTTIDSIHLLCYFEQVMNSISPSSHHLFFFIAVFESETKIDQGRKFFFPS